MKSSDARNTARDGPFWANRRFKFHRGFAKILTRLSPSLRRVPNKRLGNIAARQKLEREEKKARQHDAASYREN